MINRMEMHEEFQKQIHDAALREYLDDSWRLGEEPVTLSQWMRWSHSSDIGNPVYTNRDVLADMSLSRPFEEAAIAAGNLTEVATLCHATTEQVLDEIESGILDEEAAEQLTAERAGEDSRRRESPADQELDDDLTHQIEEAVRAIGVDCLPSARTTGEPSATVAIRATAVVSDGPIEDHSPARSTTAFESPEADCPDRPTDEEEVPEGEATRDDSPANAAARSVCSPDAHEWVAFSTALAEGWITVQCVECGAHGTVDEPTAEEWSEAFHAPSRPYRWGDPSRITIRNQVSKDQPYVIRRAAGPICECYSRRGILLPAEYERFPIEFVRSFKAETDADREELREIARFVSTTDLCSFLFPLFLRESASHCGAAGSLVTAIANRIELADSRGLHCSPAVVARVLRRAAGLRL